MEMQERTQAPGQAPSGWAGQGTPSTSGGGHSGNLSSVLQLPATLSGLTSVRPIGLTEATGLEILAELQGLRVEQAATLQVIAAQVSRIANLLEGAKVSWYRHSNCINRHHC
jgi:hypothetical protein